MKPATPTPAAKPDPSLATVEAMITELTAMRSTERSADIKRAYQAAIDRLIGLAYRLRQPRPLTIGLPPRKALAPPPDPAPEPTPGPPQASLKLGPVVVVARKPKRR